MEWNLIHNASSVEEIGQLGTVPFARPIILSATIHPYTMLRGDLITLSQVHHLRLLVPEMYRVPV